MVCAQRVRRDHRASGQRRKLRIEDRRLAGVDSDLQTSRLILGKREGLEALEEESVEVVFRNVDRLGSSLKGGEAFVLAERIPDSGALDSPLVTIAAPYPVVNNEIHVRLPDFGTGEAYTVVLGRSIEAVQQQR